jgi:hypothetical protein
MSHFPELGELCVCLWCQGTRKQAQDRQMAMMHMAERSRLAQLHAKLPDAGLGSWLPDADGNGPFFSLDREADTLRCPPPDTLLSRVGSWLVRLGRRMGGAD